MFDARYEEKRGNGKAAATLREERLPSWAQRQQIGDVTIIQWVDDAHLGDADELKRRLSERDMLLSSMLDASLAPGWNEAGETDATPVAAQPRPPLTLYSPPLAVGYKAVHSASGDEAVRAALQQAGQWLKQGKLDESTPLTNVIVVTDSRKSAEAIRPLALAEGLRDVVYTDDEGHMWNPFPPGEWLPGDE
jgi:hypothetical protein